MPTKDTYVTIESIALQFVVNVNNIILASAKERLNPPYFSGRTYYNPEYTEINEFLAFWNPEAVVHSDLDDISSNGSNGAYTIRTRFEIITGATVYNVLFEIVRKLTRVREFTSTWYHKTGTTNSYIASTSGKAIFKSNLTSYASSSNAKINSRTSGWARNISGSSLQTLSFTNPGITKDTIITADNMNKFFTNMFNAWTNLSKNKITYTFYTCHYNCHENCHQSCHGSGRSRR